MRNSFSSHEPILNGSDDPEQHYDEKTAKKTTYSFDRIFFKRFRRLLKVLFHSNQLYKFWSTKREARKHSLFWLYMTFVALGIAHESIVYFVGMIPSRYYSILTSSDITGFSRYIIPSLLLVFAAATVSNSL
jgi:ATP-binding cassette subfamily D (ALD) protein 4